MTNPADPWVQGLFTILVVVGFIGSALQMLRLLLGFLLNGEKVPTLLWRDSIFFLSVMGVIAANYVWLLAGYTAPERPLWWTLVSGSVLTVAAWIFVVFGVKRIIDTRRKRK